MAVYGVLGPFNEEEELFGDYADRCDAFMEVNDIPTAKRVNLFLASVGPATYKLVKNLCSPDNPNSKTYAQLKEVLKGYYQPAPIVIAERHKFWTACQGEGESVSAFVVRLKKLSSTCNFGAFLEEALRDRLVSGLHPSRARTQRQLLTVKDLTFTTAQEKCIADEMAGVANKEHMGETCVNEEVRKVSTIRRGPKSSTKPAVPSTGYKHCNLCGVNHPAERCRFRSAVCHACNKKGHIQRVCPARSPRSKVNQVSTKEEEYQQLDKEEQIDVEEESHQCAEAHGLYKTYQKKDARKPIELEVKIGEKLVMMELDTGASRSTIGEDIYQRVLSNYPLKETKVTLYSYSKTVIPLLGSIQVPVQYGPNPKCILELLVVKGKKPALFGRDWLTRLQVNWSDIFSVTEKSMTNTTPTGEAYPDEFNKLLMKHELLFVKESDGIKEFKARIKLKPNAKPVYQKARPVPYSLVSKVNHAYEELLNKGIMYPVTSSDWASPVVHVPKPNGEVRVCGDYKALNEVIADDGYKLPNIQDMFAKITQESGVPTVFSVIDLAGAFNQLLLDKDSAEMLVLNSCKGLLGTNRLCFGVKTAPALFQATMDKILTGINHVFCYIDDVLIATKDTTEHLKVLETVFERFAKYNVHMNGGKCQFFKSHVHYLGHSLSAEGIRPLQNKVEAILSAPTPRNVLELKSLLGMINYYGKFLPDLASKLHPLYALLHHDAAWVWNDKCNDEFMYVKQVLSSDNLLTHYDPSLPLVLSVDASPYGLGAVLSHVMSDGCERPVAYASRTLTNAEKNYAQVEKEGLAIVFGVKKIHMYLYGRRFTLVTDHQPLTKIFGSKTGIPTLAAARMQRWALMLSGYDYDILYRSSLENVNADMLSRLPIATQNEGEGYGSICKVAHLDLEDNYEFCHVIETLPMTSRDISRHTSRDPVLGKVFEYTVSGWPGHCQEEIIQPYWNRRHELSVEDGCLLWGRRVIVPSALQERLITDLHECHPGMSRMKALARGFVWWPGLDADIEDKVRSCEVCSNSQMTPQLTPLIFWPWATEPWERVHIDFAEVKGQQFLLLVDSHSKWLEVFPMESTTASATVTAIRSLFSRYGLPVEVVTDNGPQFISEEFGTFFKLNAVKHTLCPVYHPSSNGLAEKHVQTFKKMFTKSLGNLPLQHKVADVLFRYRNTPHTSTGHTPAELFLKRAPRTRLSLLKPSLQKKVEQSQAVAKQYRDGQKPKMRVYDLYQRVKVRNMRGGKEKWLPAVVVKIKGPLTYVVRLAGNRRRFVHADHLISDDTKENGGLDDHTNPQASGKNLSVIPPTLCDCSLSTEVPTQCSPVMYPQKVSSPTTELSSPARSESHIIRQPDTPGQSPNSPVSVSEGVSQPPRMSSYGRIIQAPRKLDL